MFQGYALIDFPKICSGLISNSARFRQHFVDSGILTMFEYLRPEKRTLTGFGSRLGTAFPGGPNVAASIHLRAKKSAKHLRFERDRAGPDGLRRFLSTIFKKDSTKLCDSCMMTLSPTCMKKATHVGGIRKRGNKAPQGYFRLRGKRDGCANNRPFLYSHCSDATEVQIG